MTELTSTLIENEQPAASPNEDEGDMNEPICLEHTEIEAIEVLDQPELTVNIVRRVAKKTLKYVGTISFAASTIFVVQNPEEVTTMVPGLIIDGNMDVPNLEGCDPYTPAKPLEQTPDAPIVPDSELISGTTTTTTSAPPSDPEDSEANQAISAANSNSWEAFLPDNLWKAISEYGEYFDNLEATYISDQTGIEYQFYLVGGGEPPNFNFDSLEEIEAAAFHEDVEYETPEKKQAIECMREMLFGVDGQAGKFEGRVMPIVVPTTPACVKNFRINYDKDCAQTGYKMPYADFRFLIWDLNPDFNEFMVLTTGDDYRQDAPYISPQISAHEWWHMEQEWTQGSNYEFELQPEERMARLISLKVGNEGILDCAMPIVYYVDKERMEEVVTEREGCD